MAGRDEGFIVVRKYMMNKLKLHGVPLLLYARIHGFTVNEGKGCFETHASLASAFDVSTRAIGKAFKLLKDRGLIYEDGVHQLKNGRSVKVYKAVLISERATGTNCPTGTLFQEQSSPNATQNSEQSSSEDAKKVPTDKKVKLQPRKSKGADLFDEYSF